MPFSDSQLDARLRDVPMPDGLLGRLRAIPMDGKGMDRKPAVTSKPTPIRPSMAATRGEDGNGNSPVLTPKAAGERIDKTLCDVPIPAGLLERLYAIPLAEDDGLDEALRNVPLPDDLVASCRRPGTRVRVRRNLTRRQGRENGDRALQMSRMAIAASLILAITLSLGSAMLLSLALNRSGDGELAQAKKPESPAAAVKTLELSWDALADDSSGDRAPRAEKREIELAEVGPEAPHDWVASALPRSDNLLSLPVDVEGSPPNNWDDMTESLVRPTAPVPQGLDWPLAPSANRKFLITTGFHPFVSPAADPRLQSCAVPLAMEPASYELARRYLERNEWPPIDRDAGIRTEDFLAAVDYGFPKPQQEGLGLSVAGGPSPISGDGYSLLQIGVQARHIDDSSHAPVHLVLLVDTSTSMRWGSRLEIIRRALGDISEMVGPDDRLSLVTFNQASHVLVEYLGRYDLPTFAAAAESLSAQGATNIVGGLREAYGVARQSHGPGRPAVRIVLLTDGLLDLESMVAEKVRGQVAQAAGENIPLDVVELGQLNKTDPQVTMLADAGRGKVHRATSAEQVRWALREIVTGRSQVVARSVKLEVAFNPKSVVAYRLLGHESRDWLGLLPGPVTADFCDGQTATALFEVQLAPNGPSEIAAVDLTWYEPQGRSLAGKTQQAAHEKVHRSQFAASLAGSAESLQEAAVVAYTAEVLRHSPFIFQGQHEVIASALFRGLELANQVDRQLRQRPAFAEFVTFIRQEMKAHPAARRAMPQR